MGDCRTRASLRRSLGTLPPTLDKTYDRILSAISEADSQYAVPILRWLTFSARPLSVDEVAEIVAIDLEDEAKFDREEVLEDPLDVLNICSSLVIMTTDEKDRETRSARQIVALAHYSVKEYLLSDRIGKGSAAQYGMQHAVCHDAIARSCLGYLLQFQGVEMLGQNNAKEFRLADYSARFWIEHAQATEEQTGGYSQEAMVLFWEKKNAYLNWLRIHNPDRSWEMPDFKKILKLLPAPLYYASLFGLRRVVELLVEKGADVNAQGGDYGNALQAASYRGHEAIVRLLVDNGADVNAQGGNYDNALYAASSRGHEQIVRLLVDKGADVKAEGGYHGNALYAASERGHEQIVRLLLDNGADVNAKGGKYGHYDALYAASSGGHEQIVRLLVDKGADVKAEGGYHGNALYAASERGHEQIVRLLLDNGADVHKMGGWWGDNDALKAASSGGHEQVVKLLLEKNADVNAQSGYHGNALQAASEEGHEQIVRLLVDNGADVNAQGGWYGNALQAASEGGHEAIVRLLVDNGAIAFDQGIATANFRRRYARGKNN